MPVLKFERAFFCNFSKIYRMKTILITGGTGLVGMHLSQKLTEKGYKVALLSRRKHNDSQYETYLWNPGKTK
jgi:GDP-D-mannose dehydratase